MDEFRKFKIAQLRRQIGRARNARITGCSRAYLVFCLNLCGDIRLSMTVA